MNLSFLRVRKTLYLPSFFRYDLITFAAARVICFSKTRPLVEPGSIPPCPGSMTITGFILPVVIRLLEILSLARFSLIGALAGN